METFNNIQALRAVAALVVVWAHLKEIFPENGFLSRLPSGLAGVDLFFVISGFIMVVSTNSGKKTPCTFLIDRFTRVAPLYYIFTLLVFIISIAAPSLLKSSTADLTSLLKSIAFVPFLKTEYRIYPTYYLGWTLNYEMFFYLIFAIGMFFERRFAFTATTIIVLVAAGYVFTDLYSKSVILYAFTRQIMLDFVFGMCIAMVREPLANFARSRPALPVCTLFAGIAGIIFAERFLTAATDEVAPATDTVLRYGISAALIVASAVALEKSGHAVRNRIFLLVGNASYSLYLSHFFIVGAVIAIANRFSLSTATRIPLALVTFAVCIIFAILSHYVIEKPTTNFFRRIREAKVTAKE